MLTPEEIEGLELPRTFVGGYKPEKVTEHLRRVAWDIRRLLHERDVADAELTRLRRELARSERREELEAAALGSAQRAAREIREASRQEAEVVLKKASEYATRLVRDVNREHAERTRELAELRAVNSKLRTQLRAFLKSLVEVVEAGDLETKPSAIPLWPTSTASCKHTAPRRHGWARPQAPFLPLRQLRWPGLFPWPGLSMIPVRARRSPSTPALRSVARARTPSRWPAKDRPTRPNASPDRHAARRRLGEESAFAVWHS